MPFKPSRNRRRRSAERNAHPDTQVVSDLRGAVYAITAPLRVHAVQRFPEQNALVVDFQTTDEAYDLAVPLRLN